MVSLQFSYNADKVRRFWKSRYNEARMVGLGGRGKRQRWDRRGTYSRKTDNSPQIWRWSAGNWEVKQEIHYSMKEFTVSIVRKIYKQNLDVYWLIDAISWYNFITFFNYSCFQYPDLIDRSILCPGLHKPHSLHDSEPSLNSAKDCMLPVQPGSRGQGNEELASIRIGTTVRHTQDARPRMFQFSVDFVCKLFAIDGATASTGSGRIACLEHEVGDDAVEDDVIVVAFLC